MSLLRWSFVFLMLAFASGLMGITQGSLGAGLLAMSCMWIFMCCFVVLASLGTFVFRNH